MDLPIPLLPDDSDLPLDLQAAVAAVYDLLRCERMLDYTEPLRPQLQGKAKAWVEARLRAAGKIV